MELRELSHSKKKELFEAIYGNEFKVEKTEGEKNGYYHPECQDGEVFMGNVCLNDFMRIGWKTKRAGKQAYDVNGNPVKEAKNCLAGTNVPFIMDCSGQKVFPCFVKREELIGAGIDPESVCC